MQEAMIIGHTGHQAYLNGPVYLDDGIVIVPWLNESLQH
jgi:hypothetical protein